MDEKRCSRCSCIKSIGEFRSHLTSPDRRSYWCKSCHAEYAVDRRISFIAKHSKAPPVVNEKRCSKCREIKPGTEFGIVLGSIDGLNPICFSCNSMARKLKVQSGESAAAFRRSRKRHPERIVARSIVGRALKSGALVRESCVVCGSQKSQAHHEDYSRPLEIVWLCQKHHTERHLEIKMNSVVSGNFDFLRNGPVTR